MESDSNKKPVWEGFALLGLRLARSIAEIADTQTQRVSKSVEARVDTFYTERDAVEEPRRRAIHMVSSLFDETMDRLAQLGRKSEDD